MNKKAGKCRSFFSIILILNFGDEYARRFDSSSAITIGFMRSSKVNNVQYAFSNSSNNSALVFDFAMLTPIKI